MFALRRHSLQRITSTRTTPSPITTTLTVWRPFSNDGKDDDKDDKESDANFFLQSEETLPPPASYVRDSLTGKWTNQTRAELTKKDARLLTLDEDSKDDELMKRLEERWEVASKETEGKDDGDGLGALNSEHERVAGRILEEKLAMGPIGRGGVLPADEAGGDGIPLSKRELSALKGYAQKRYKINPKDFERELEEDPELLPHGSVSSGTAQDRSNILNTDSDLAYLNQKLNKMAFAPEGTEHQHSDPFADLLPKDFDPARKVNRRLAKPLPTKSLHHNNLVLLRRYSTPGGKIMNRVQSRLGAKDQRKIAKLIKRARHLGLIPHMGQWKFEDHGSLHDSTLDEKKDWEVELEERGLWPLADEQEVFKRYYGMDELLDRAAGERGTKKREQLEELLSAGTQEWREKMKAKEDGDKSHS